MKQSNRPLVEALHNFKKQHPVSLHVPGHKHGLLSRLPQELRSALSYDFTELAGLDDLHEADGVIKASEVLLSQLYKSTRSFFLVNGSTVGNLAMIYAICGQGDTVIIQRNAHKSVFNAVELTGALPVLITPPWDTNTQTPGTLTVEQVQEVLDAYPEAKGIVLTYPTYYGVTGSDLKPIIELCHSRSVPVLVDEAHGAHFIVGEPFPKSALELGADVVVHSAHKTLPALTMASFLHVRSDFIEDEKIAYYLQMLQSSSPSYLLMASLDDARAYAASFNENDKQHFLELRKTFLEAIKNDTPYEIIETADPLKLLLRLVGYTGYELQEALESQGIYAELADPFQVLFVLPLWNASSTLQLESWLTRLTDAVPLLNKMPGSSVRTDIPEWPVGISTLACPPSKWASVQVEWVPLEKSVGRIAGSSLIPYPPGIPLLMKGELIQNSHLSALSDLMKMGSRFHGASRLIEGQIQVMKRDMEA